MGNPFESRSSLSGYSSGLSAVSPSDDDDLSEVGVGLFTVDGGDIKFDDATGVTHTITFPAWSTINCGVAKVHETGTTATLIYVGVF